MLEIAALYVQTGGCYFGLPDVDPWDEARDARRYGGPWPVVAHPPCERWGRYAQGSPATWGQYRLGYAAGCFAAAIASVRCFGGVLEHPEGTHAWRVHALPAPVKAGGWTPTVCGGWVCCVEQGHYGHLARKATWLYAYGVTLPELHWGPSEAKMRLDEGYHSAEERRRAVRRGVTERLTRWQRAATPLPFRDLLLSIARSARAEADCA